MRVTAETKTRTRREILLCARRLFARKGFEATTTRDIAADARIGVGTLFNYFPTKEALAANLMTQALDAGRAEFHASIRGDERLEELLFAHAAIGLRHLRPCRSLIVPVLETTLSPLAADGACSEAGHVRREHLETVARILNEHTGRQDGEPSAVSLQLYWALYLGVLAFWARDESAHQEDTLGLLDQSMRLFAEAQRGPSIPPSLETLP